MRWMCVRRAIFWVILLLSGVTSGPETAGADDRARFQAYLQSPGHQASVLELWRTEGEFLCGQGEEPEQLGRVGLWILGGVRFGDGPDPVDGAWMQRMRGPSCGRESTYNFLYAAEPGSPPKGIILIPGMSRADMVLQRDVIQALVPAAALEAGCAGGDGAEEAEDAAPPEFRILDTSQDKDFRSGVDGEWREVWEVRVCGVDLSMIVTFLSDGQGGTHFNVEPR